MDQKFEHYFHDFAMSFNLLKNGTHLLLLSSNSINI